MLQHRTAKGGQHDVILMQECPCHAMSSVRCIAPIDCCREIEKVLDEIDQMQ